MNTDEARCILPSLCASTNAIRVLLSVCRPRWKLDKLPDGPPLPVEPLSSYEVGDAVDVLVNSLHWEGVVVAVRRRPPETVTVHGTGERSRH